MRQYKIKRPISKEYIPLSNRIEKLLDIQWKDGKFDDIGLFVRYEIVR